jgi:hypothetical protein
MHTSRPTDFWCHHDAVETGQSFQSVVLGQLDIHMQKNETRPLPCMTYKSNSKWTKDLKLQGKHFWTVRWTRLQKAQGTKPEVDEWDYIKLKSFHAAKETISRVQRQPTKWEKCLQHIHLKRHWHLE